MPPHADTISSLDLCIDDHHVDDDELSVTSDDDDEESSCMSVVVVGVDRKDSIASLFVGPSRRKQLQQDDDEASAAETSTSSSSLSSVPRRRVRFADTEGAQGSSSSLVQIRDIENRTEWDASVKTDYWYNKAEYAKMKKHMSNMLNRLNKNKKIDEVRHTAFGLELYSMTVTGRGRVRRQARTRQTVARAAAKRRNKRTIHAAAEDLARLSLKCSRACREAAVARAAVHAAFVRNDNPAYYASKPQFLSTTALTTPLWMAAASSATSCSAQEAAQEQDDQEDGLDWLQQPLHQFVGQLFLGLP